MYNFVTVRERIVINNSGSFRNYWKECGFTDDENHLVVNSAGYQKFITKNFAVKREKGRVDYQIIYLLKGKGLYHFEGRTMEIHQGNVIIYSPGQPQLYEYFFEDGTELYWIHFTGYGAEEVLSGTGLLHGQVFYIGSSNECVELYKKIIYELKLKRPMFTQIAAAYLIELISQIARRVEEQNSGSSVATSEGIQRVIGMMHANYSKNYSIKDFAVECNLSPSRFIHKFKTFTGTSPGAYITRIRMDEAKELLANSSLSVSEVSTIIGYENPLYFSRIFRKMVGIPPSVYRAQPF